MFMSTRTSRTPQRLFTILKIRTTVLPQCQNPHRNQRQYASQPIPLNAPPKGASVAVLGGGITGLVSTYVLSQIRPDLKITLFEGSHRLGGWLQSTKVDVGTGEVVFEQGPRSLRPAWPNGYFTLDLIDRLDMGDRLIFTPKSSPAAQNRFIYYPDHLVRMPGPGLSTWENIQNILTESLFDELPAGLLKDVWASKRSPKLQDESIGSFISRRFGSSVADDIASAVFHGIYAGDIYKLSARSTMPLPWFYEAFEGSVLLGALRATMRRARPVWRSRIEQDALSYMKRRSPSKANLAARNSSVFTFKEGIGELANRLEARLRSFMNVKILDQCPLEAVVMKGHGRNAKIELTWDDLSTKNDTKRRCQYSHVISTLPAQTLAGIVPEQTRLPSLSQSKAVTVMVVNLFYENPSLLPVQGFGYLLPRSLPIEQNPERALGVIFDSHAAVGQDQVEGTKLTVMLGGHWWDDFDSHPEDKGGVVMAKCILERHLNITENPKAVRVSLQKDCIPQYEVGHAQRMARANAELGAFEGRLRVAGSSYTGVGLNDCVKAATLCAAGLAHGRPGTGLGSFVENQGWFWESK